MVQAKVIRVVLELLGGAVAAFCEPQTPPVSLSTTGPEGVIHINSAANIEAVVAVLELETLSRPAYVRALRKLHMQETARRRFCGIARA